MRATRRVRRYVLVAALAGGGAALAGVGASAFTASNSFSNTNTTVGYGTQTVSGASVTSVVYGLSSDGSTINSVTLETSGDTSGSAADVGFTVGGVAGPTSSCGAGTFTSGTPGYTTYSCTGLSQTLSTVQSINIAVH